MSHYHCMEDCLIDTLCKHFLPQSWEDLQLLLRGEKQAPDHHWRSPGHTTYSQSCTITSRRRVCRGARQAYNLQKADPGNGREGVDGFKGTYNYCHCDQLLIKPYKCCQENQKLCYCAHQHGSKCAFSPPDFSNIRYSAVFDFLVGLPTCTSQMQS